MSKETPDHIRAGVDNITDLTHGNPNRPRDQTDLLPCPFCGGADVYLAPDETGSGGQWVPPIHVGCKACQLDLVAGDDRTEAVAAWNRRAPPLSRAQAAEAIIRRVWKISTRQDHEITRLVDVQECVGNFLSALTQGQADD